MNPRARREDRVAETPRLTGAEDALGSEVFTTLTVLTGRSSERILRRSILVVGRLNKEKLCGADLRGGVQTGHSARTTTEFELQLGLFERFL
jgi:hypothetical protein